MSRSLAAVFIGTFTLRFSTGLTGTMIVYLFAELPKHGGQDVSPLTLGVLMACFYAAELLLAPPFGMLSDRLGHHRVMQWGPIFGAVAVTLTWLTTNLVILGGTRLLEGASTAASVPSILGFIAIVTAGDVALRGKASARFEAATLAGLGLGIVAAGPLFEVFGRLAFLMNAVIYVGSFLIYRFWVPETPGQAPAPAGEVGSPRSEAPAPHEAPVLAERYGVRRYWTIFTSSHVWLLAPTWIAINAALGIATGQSVFQLVKKPDPRFADQMLMGRVTPTLVSIGLAVGLVVFFAGLIYWGNRFKSLRRTTIIFYGVLGGATIVIAAALLNHSDGAPRILHVLLGLAVIAGVFVLSGATPAALGLLADLSEAYPADRGAIMGLYSVFLGLGQITGNLLGGAAAEFRGVDGLLGATLLLLAIAVVPLFRLRSFEHVVGMSAGRGTAREGSSTGSRTDPAARS